MIVRGKFFDPKISLKSAFSKGSTLSVQAEIWVKKFPSTDHLFEASLEISGNCWFWITLNHFWAEQKLFGHFDQDVSNIRLPKIQYASMSL